MKDERIKSVGGTQGHDLDNMSRLKSSELLYQYLSNSIYIQLIEIQRNLSRI